jgi:hypothetical protein
MAAVALFCGLRGADWPAQLYRVELFQRAGFTVWNNNWYGGHPTLGYSILYPPLGAIAGIEALAIASCAVAAWWFARLAGDWLEPRSARVAAWSFAAGTVTNVVVGRLTFALGLAVGMVAVAALARSSRIAVPLGALASLASPVAGLFVAIVAASSWVGGPRTDVRQLRRATAVAAGALAPIAVTAALFPQRGHFPFRFGHFLVTLGVAAAVFLLAPRPWRVVRFAAVVYAAVAIGAFFVPNPVGGNVARLAMFVGGPLCAGLAWPRRKPLLLVAALPIAVWQWQPAVLAVMSADRDPSVHASYYRPLVEFLEHQPLTRVEIPFTRQHWEAAYVAPYVPLARGWERQLDFAYNGLFYDDTLDPGEYLRWLEDNAIGFVALADVELDHSAVAEAALLRGGLPGLTLAWRSEDWTVWRVEHAKPLVDGPAELVDLDPDAFTLRVAEPGDVVVRIRSGSHWDADGAACVAATADGWTLVRAEVAGIVRVRQAPLWTPLSGGGSHCEQHRAAGPD